jgi:hypothetical protein
MVMKLQCNKKKRFIDMKILSLLILLLTFVSCGKDTKTNSTSNTLSVNGIQLNTATISVPAPGMVGGGISIEINGKSYQIDSSKSSSDVQLYLQALYNGRTGVTPTSTDHYSTKYKGAYAGSLQQGACTFNPMATCTNAVLTQLMAY